ncbi:MAG: hypothetical protein KIT27_09470 [Legionellales bacterium]|nr:hypothetical protein [Legionellales bacterium]
MNRFNMIVMLGLSCLFQLSLASECNVPRGFWQSHSHTLAADEGDLLNKIKLLQPKLIVAGSSTDFANFNHQPLAGDIKHSTLSMSLMNNPEYHLIFQLPSTSQWQVSDIESPFTVGTTHQLYSQWVMRGDVLLKTNTTEKKFPATLILRGMSNACFNIKDFTTWALVINPSSTAAIIFAGNINFELPQIYFG